MQDTTNNKKAIEEKTTNPLTLKLQLIRRIKDSRLKSKENQPLTSNNQQQLTNNN